MQSIFGFHTYGLVFAYNGTDYAGWQRQTNCGRTVQETLEDVLRNLFHRSDIVLTACGRTDAGVHALGMTASFRIDMKLNLQEFTAALGKRVPHDMRIISVSELPEGENAKSLAFGKAYVYAVNKSYENLFLKNACWSWADVSDMTSVREAVKLFEGTHDFINFTGAKRDTATTVRTIVRAELYDFSPVYCFYFSGSGFLHKMVRRMVGFLHSIALGELTSTDLENALNTPCCDLCEAVAPPRGLYLKRVFASRDELIGDTLENPPFYQ